MHIQEIKISEKESIWVEVEDAEIKKLAPNKESAISDLPDGAESIGVNDNIVEAVQALKSNISAMASTVHESLKEHHPAEWGIEINIGFKGKANVIPVILSGEASGGIKVTAKWKKD